jgi:hypothetical protein
MDLGIARLISMRFFCRICKFFAVFRPLRNAADDEISGDARKIAARVPQKADHYKGPKILIGGIKD